jgi:dihydrodipicolinate synthase/N-acetylneuraminate lyase
MVHHVDYLIRSGVHGIITTMSGEFIAMSKAEQLHAIQVIIDMVVHPVCASLCG